MTATGAPATDAGAVLYHVRVRGGVPAGEAFAYPGVLVVEGGPGISVLSCPLASPDEVSAFVAYLHDLGLQVVDMVAIEEPPEEQPEEQPEEPPEE